MIPENIPNVIVLIAPIFAVLLFALPSYYGVLKQRKLTGVMIIVILGIYALLVETAAIKTGFPYGDFSYGDTLGPKLLGSTPWVVALVYPPILLTAFWLASKFTRSFPRIILTAIFVTLVDVVLNPATVRLEFWAWDTPGSFYGVPLINFVGWFISALIGGFILHKLWGKDHRVKAPVAYSGLAVLLFWTGVNAGIAQKIPLGIGTVFGLLILVIVILEKQQFKESDN